MRKPRWSPPRELYEQVSQDEWNSSPEIEKKLNKRVVDEFLEEKHRRQVYLEKLAQMEKEESENS